MKAFISGTVMSVYSRQSKNRDGEPITIQVADVYSGHEVVKVNKVDKSIVAGKAYDKIPVSIYSNQYGLLVVFDNAF